MHNSTEERLHGEITFSISVNIDNVDADEDQLVDDLKRTFARAISANERFLPKGVGLDELWCDFIHLYTKDEDDRFMDYQMNTNPKV